MLALRPRTISQWTGLGFAAGVVIGVIRLAAVAAYWPRGGALLSYFVLACVNTMVAAAAAGAAIGVIARRPRHI